MAHIVNLRHEPALRAALDGKAEHGGTVRIDRRSQWGNRFRIGPDGPRDEVIARYRADLWRRIRAAEVGLDELAALHGKPLACWCAPLPAMGRSSPAPRHGRPPSWRNGGEREAGEGRTPRGGRERAPGIGNTEGEPKCNPLPRGASPVRVEGLPPWQSRLRGCGYASVAVTGHAVFGRSLRAGLSAAISAPLRFSLLSLSPPLAGARCALLACRAGARDPGLNPGTAQGVRANR